MKIISGKIESAQKIVIYGPEGIGKSTFASKFPDALFIDTEGSTKHLDVKRTPTPTSWAMLLSQVDHIKQNPDICQTLIIDTADWAERLAINHICAAAKKTSIEDWGYGKGYVILSEEFGRFLNQLNELIELGINIVLAAHAHIRKFEQPDEMGAYDRWELKLQRRTAPMVKEWADMVLFANYKTFVVTDESSMAKSKKAQGGKRVIYTTHHPAWDAKNRHDLPEELPLDFAAIAHVLPNFEKEKDEIQEAPPADVPEMPIETEERTEQAELNPDIPKALRDLMQAHEVSEWELQQAVAHNGYYPEDTPIANYDPDFIEGVLIAAWDQVYKVIQEKVVPF